jgi:ribonuclease E
MTVPSQNSLVNDIYRGRVVNLEPAIGAAFVDFGQGRNGFLHTSDVMARYGDKDWSLDQLVSTRVDPEEMGESDQADLLDSDEASEASKPGRKRPRATRSRRRQPITELLKKGQLVVAQVTKEAIGDKGPTLTTYISIPGRYLVLMPTISRIGVSRKIDDEKERRRLKRILQSLEIPDGMGVIVRTAGTGHTKADLKRDLEYLLHAWADFTKRLSIGRGPMPLYQESDVAIRTMRDLFTESTEAVYVDDPGVHARLLEFTEQLMPEHIDRIRLYGGARPLFHAYGVEQDFERIFARRVDLPSGGSIVFDQTEALVAIDVNSGKTRTGGYDFEEIALKANLEAVEEIARQIRLRDLGGIVVIDFIDMMRSGNMRAVERAFRQALSTDRARSKIGRISQFGLLELTRQRLGPGLTKKLFHHCPRCRGTGRERNVESRAAAILRRLGSALTLKGFSMVEVRALPEVIDFLENECENELRALEHRHDRRIQLAAAPEQVEDSVLRYLRADGREVRPGGRRKR